MKKLLFVMAAMFAATALNAQTEDNLPVVTSVEDSVTTVVADTTITEVQKFGYLSYNAILKAMPDYAVAQKSISDLKQKYDEEMKRTEQDFTKKFNEFIDGQKNFPENIMLKRQKELQMLMDEGLKFKDEVKKLLTNAEAELMKPVYQKLNDILSAIGTEHDYMYILNTDANAYPFMNMKYGEDVTAAVKEKLGIE
ncbi:MAG: OmpH family outer membrane protein [Bacteroidaceae bacterium]|nr:OmpH family outer membrane protein [Bacteroidaceae bacterium]